MQNALSSPRLAVGTTLAGRFVIAEPVGEGGMAVVYRAHDLATQAQVAVKLLHGGTKSPFIHDHFLHEAQILATLRHPHIVAYIAHGESERGEAFLAMEWLDGEDLEHRLRRGPLGLREAIRMIGHIASALAVTHARGIVHRGPQNRKIFVEEYRSRAVLGNAREILRCLWRGASADRFSGSVR